MQTTIETFKNCSEISYESDEETQNLMLKSSLSSPSTVDSPLFSPSKSDGLDTEEEDENCLQFQVRGFCQLGESCDCEHQSATSGLKHGFMLKNYPELLLAAKPRRMLSFIC